jgi:hypothetical protein
MSFLDSFTKKSRLTSTIRQINQARKNEGAKADHLFKSVYEEFAEILTDDPLRAQALYFWGHALLHQAKTKSGDEAARLYEEARAKFTFCRIIDPNYLAAAIDGGVACMDLARLRGVGPDAELYDMAKKEFEKANAIQAGAASYNLACIYALRGDKDACLKALETSRDKGSLPNADDILNDPDLAGVKNQDWFLRFMASLNEPKEATEESTATTEETKPKPVAKSSPKAKEAKRSSDENDRAAEDAVKEE